MTPGDLMRAVVPVCPPYDSNRVREGSLRGEQLPGELQCAPSKFFLLFDTDGDGLISFAEWVVLSNHYIYLLTYSQIQSKIRCMQQHTHRKPHVLWILGTCFSSLSSVFQNQALRWRLKCLILTTVGEYSSIEIIFQNLGFQEKYVWSNILTCYMYYISETLIGKSLIESWHWCEIKTIKTRRAKGSKLV